MHVESKIRKQILVAVEIFSPFSPFPFSAVAGWKASLKHNMISLKPLLTHAHKSLASHTQFAYISTYTERARTRSIAKV